MRYTFALLLTGLLLTLPPTAGSQSTAPEIWVVNLDGAVGPASVDMIIRTIDDATSGQAQAVILRMDTPGGLDAAMRDLVEAILASTIPIITYVAPDGARAASAGTYIAYASHIAAMAPATNIGSSTPVSISGPATPAPAPGPAPGKPPLPSLDSDEEAPSTAVAADPMTNKIVNDAVAYLQSLAELRGRNIDWAEATVREGANLRATEALAQNVIDIVATSINDLMLQLDNRQVAMATGSVTLRTKDARIVHIETDWRHELLSIITDPSIAYGLLLIGVYGLILEFYSPGMIFPAVTGVICILVGAYGLQMLPFNYAGFALIALGLGLIVAEAVTPTFGVLGIGGLIAFVIGSTILIDTDVPGYSIPIGVIAGFTIATGAILFFIVGAAINARRQVVVTGVRGMVGGSAVVIEDFDGQGRVRAFGEIWTARTEGALSKGAKVKVTGVDGLTLTITKEE